SSLRRTPPETSRVRPRTRDPIPLLALLVALRLGRLRRGGHRATFLEHVAGNLEDLLVSERLADAERQHAFERVAGRNAVHHVLNLAAMQPEIVGQVRTDKAAEIRAVTRETGVVRPFEDRPTLLE